MRPQVRSATTRCSLRIPPHRGLCLLGAGKIEILAREPFGEADIASTGMCLHAFQARNTRCDRGDLSVRITRHALPGDRLQKFRARPCNAPRLLSAECG